MSLLAMDTPALTGPMARMGNSLSVTTTDPQVATQKLAAAIIRESSLMLLLCIFNPLVRSWGPHELRACGQGGVRAFVVIWQRPGTPFFVGQPRLPQLGVREQHCTTNTVDTHTYSHRSAVLHPPCCTAVLYSTAVLLYCCRWRSSCTGSTWRRAPWRRPRRATGAACS